MKLRKFLAATCAVTLLLGMAATPEVASEMKLAITANAASSEVPIDTSHFPDAKFRQSILNGLDKNKNGYLSTEEAAVATSLHCDGEDITSLKGIEYFPELKLLDCSYNQLTELDISKNTALESLNCSSNYELSELDVSENTALKDLNCSYNDITSLDVSNNTALTELNCYYSDLEELDVSNNTLLEYLDCSDNQLTELDVSNNTALKDLACYYCNLNELDVSNNTLLEYLDCSGNQLTELDVSKNTALTDLDCSYNQLISLDISKNTALAELSCFKCGLVGLDISKNVLLRNLSCYGNSITDLDISNNTYIIKAYLDTKIEQCYEDEFYFDSYLYDFEGDEDAYSYSYGWSVDKYTNIITGLDLAAKVDVSTENFPDDNFRAYVSENIDTDNDGKLSAEEIFSVDKIDVSYCDIGSLKGIEYFSALAELNCWGNQLTELDISKNTALERLRCYYNQLTELDISANTDLTYLDCSDNQLTSLDVSTNTALTDLDCSDNQLTSLDVKYNIWLTNLYCSNNDLTTLDVSKNTELTKLNCSDNQLTSLDVKFNDWLTTLYCDNNNFTSLDISGCAELYELWCSGNRLTSLDVSGCTVLDELWCSDNLLTSIDVSTNTALTILLCYKNQLKELDVSKNTELTDLNCSQNKLTELDISKNIKLDELYCEENELTNLDIKNIPKLIMAYQNGEASYEDNKKYYLYTDDENYFGLSVDDPVEIIVESKDHTHTWNFGTVTKAATCAATGVKTYTCTVCGATKTETIAKTTTHKYDSGKVTKAATYAAAGVKTYTCTVCGATKTSSIAKKTVNKVAAKSAFTCTSSAVRINWNSLSSVSGYRIFRYDPAKKTWVGIANIYDPNATNYRVSGLNAGTTYKFKVKAFVKENGKTYFGTASSTITTSTKPKTTTITKANKVSTAVRLYWNKLTCTGYRIDRYDSAQKKWVKVKAISSSATTQYRISGLKKNTTYKFRIVPFVKLGNKFIYGAASKTFAVKTTK